MWYKPKVWSLCSDTPLSIEINPYIIHVIALYMRIWGFYFLVKCPSVISAGYKRMESFGARFGFAARHSALFVSFVILCVQGYILACNKCWFTTTIVCLVSLKPMLAGHSHVHDTNNKIKKQWWKVTNLCISIFILCIVVDV